MIHLVLALKIILHNDNIQYSIEKSLMKAKSVQQTKKEKFRDIYSSFFRSARDIGLPLKIH